MDRRRQYLYVFMVNEVALHVMVLTSYLPIAHRQRLGHDYCIRKAASMETLWADSHDSYLDMVGWGRRKRDS